MTLGDVPDDELWAEVERRELATVIGYVNPEQMSRADPSDEASPFVGHVLFASTWLHRYPVYGLRDGDLVVAP